MTKHIGGQGPAGRVIGTSSLDWVELEHLSAHLGELHSRYRAARAMKRVSDTNAIEREIAKTVALRQRLVSRLSSRLVDQITAPWATPAGAQI
jgi:hypothetical protein